MSRQQILVLGGGFAGLWSALGAQRKLAELGREADVEVTLVSADAFHNIRVRNYEADLSAIRVPLDDVLEPIGVQRVEGKVVDVDWESQVVSVKTAQGEQRLAYDRLVFALGSQLVRPSVPGLVEYGFDVNTYPAAERLSAHLQSLAQQPAAPGQWTVVVVGAGLTGTETATEMPARLRKLQAEQQITQPCRVILVDHNPHVGSDMGDSARPVIEQALAALGIETRLGTAITAITAEGITLATGEQIPARTVVWCAGMHANPLTQLFPVEKDRLGRVAVDEFMRVRGMTKVFAAGDVASATLGGTHTSVMSCQHGRPMGRFAGHNVVCDLFGLPMLPLKIDWYVTVLDLGPWGAVYTEGWDRQVIAQGAAAKHTKQVINCQRIYPPLNRNREEILAAAAPIVQRPPEIH
ncbi:MAG: NAD(P)/FAD-dependent oxidoreductase [Bythopirellula sp.]|nr:NAD(P)/FAD-dependent oxidoreductase [Bythopirellula sp.]